MILVIIIAAAWIVILAPSLMKRRSQSVGEIGSISHFHRPTPGAGALRNPSPSWPPPTASAPS